MGLNTEQYSFLEQMAERMREEQVPDLPLNDRSRELQEQLQRRDDQIAELQEKLGASDSYGDEIKISLEKMRQVIERLFQENKELRSANLKHQAYGGAPAQTAAAPVQVVYAPAPAPAAPAEGGAAPEQGDAAAPAPPPIPEAQQAVQETPTKPAIRVPEPPEDDDEPIGDRAKTSGPGTPLERDVLSILGSAGPGAVHREASLTNSLRSGDMPLTP